MEERLIEMEIKLAHQERLLTDLDEVLQAFTARVEVLEHTVSEIRENALAVPIGKADEKPPHY